MMAAEVAMAPDKALLSKLTYDEKLEWLDAISVSIHQDPAMRETPEWHREVIRQRLRRMDTDPQPGYTIDELFDKLRNRDK
jgi:hypothetical protein